MKRASPWDRILRAHSTCVAVELAARLPVSELSNSELPLSFESLSRRSQLNVRAVRRALGVRVTGVAETGWEIWQETEAELRTRTANRTAKPTLGEKREGGSILDDEGLFEEGHSRRQNDQQVNDTACNPKEVSSSAIARNVENRLDGTKRLKADKEGEENALEAKEAPAANEVKFAEQLSHWATSSPHAAPPKEAVQAISRSAHVPALLRIIAPHERLASLLAPVVSVFTESVASSSAIYVVEILVVPYVNELNAPAPRDVMQATLSFAERHWRAILSLFSHVCERQTPVNSAVAELLVRIAAVMPAQGAMLGFRAFSQIVWGEHGIRVVEALLMKSRTEKGIAGILVPALERNGPGSEKSVRFGKLLFSCVRDVPDIASTYKDAMESICSRSKVFLAKRALAMLHKKAGSA